MAKIRPFEQYASDYDRWFEDHPAVYESELEALPFPDECVDYILFVTTICFLDSLEKAFCEAYRVLNPAGLILVGFIDKNSVLGRDYEKRKHESRFYRNAVFRSVDEVSSCLEKAGFGALRFVQTIFRPIAQITAKEPVRDGYGKGAFVVARATKRNSPASMI